MARTNLFTPHRKGYTMIKTNHVFIPDPYEGDTYNLLLMLWKDYSQDPYAPDTLEGDGLYYRPDAILEPYSDLQSQD